MAQTSGGSVGNALALANGEIEAGIYPGIPSTPTLQVHALLVVNAAMNEGVVYRATTALWSDSTVAAIQNGHPQGKAVSLQTALNGISIPLQ